MANKKAVTTEDAWKIQETHEGNAACWIQWKATDVFMDFYCKCGNHSNISGEFAYHIKCPDCGTVYMCNGHIELIELEKEPAGAVTIGE